jgi:hypothetical protein
MCAANCETHMDSITRMSAMTSCLKGDFFQPGTKRKPLHACVSRTNSFV